MGNRVMGQVLNLRVMYRVRHGKRSEQGAKL